MEHIECCGTCEYHNGLGHCRNKDSWCYAFYMDSKDSCPEYLEDEKKVMEYELLRISKER